MKEGKLNAISLFSGIGGFELGLKQYIRTLLYCEADKHAQAVLLSRMSEGAIDNAPICTDVQELTGEFIDVPIDIIFGGFPCTDISVAGKGAGLEGERSGLFFEIVRLAREVKPPFLFLENVSAIRTRGLDRVIQELTAIGYDLRWTMLSAADVGAKHKRERWFLLAYSKSNDDRRRLSDLSGENAKEQRSEDEHQDTTRKPLDSSNDARILADTDQSRSQGWNSDLLCQCSSEQPFRQSGTPISDTNSGRCEQCDEKFRTIPIADESGAGSSRANSENKTSMRREWSLPKPEEQVGSRRDSGEGILSHDEWWISKSNMGRVVDGVSSPMVQSQPDYLSPAYWQQEPEGIPRVTEEKEQRVERIKRLGNAVVPLQVKTAFEYLIGIIRPPVPAYVEYEEVDFC